MKKMAESGRYMFIKDTCCDLNKIQAKLDAIKGSDIMIFNANGATLAESIRMGCEGYSGVMANFHPELYNWLCKNVDSPYADLVQSFFCMSAFTEYLAYPCTSKIYLNKNLGLPIKPYSRTRDYHLATKYHTDCIDQMEYLANHIKSIIGIK
jgi:4-hydroxy-tetrahydrodipicolinate synthase